jgi:hypothetical protein
MSDQIKILGRSATLPPIDRVLVKIHVDFGPSFGPETMNRSEFVTRLRQLAIDRHNNFLGVMFSHFADHIEAAARYFPGEQFSLDHPATLHGFECTYGGDGSCDDCSISHPGGTCCTCECDGTTSCEPCG